MNSLILVIRSMVKRIFKPASAYRVPTTIHLSIVLVMATRKWEYKRNRWPWKNRTKLQSHSSRIVCWRLRIKMAMHNHNINRSQSNHPWWLQALSEAISASLVNIKKINIRTKEGWAWQIIQPTQFTGKVWHQGPMDNSVSNPEVPCKMLPPAIPATQSSETIVYTKSRDLHNKVLAAATWIKWFRTSNSWWTTIGTCAEAWIFDSHCLTDY